MTEFSYSRAYSYGQWDVDASVSTAIEAALPGKVFTVRCDAGQLVIDVPLGLSPTDEDTLDATIEAHRDSLSRLKQQRYQEIDRKTRYKLILGGFEYPESSGQVFSNSAAMQRTITRIYDLRNDPSTTYPVPQATMDNNVVINLADAAAVAAFYEASVDAIRTYRDSGNALKTQVRDAVTVEEIVAVVDER